MSLEWMIFIHALGAVAVGYYLLLPLATAKLSGLSNSGKEGMLSGLFVLNRIGQWLLVLQFLTGGYMISKKEYQYWWMAAAVIAGVLVAAFAGMMAGPMKRALAAYRQGGEAAPADLRKLQLFAKITAVILLITVFLMYAPTLFPDQLYR